MEWDDSGKPITITKWQALLHHERSVWETDYASVRTQQVDGTPCDDPTIKRKIAKEISRIIRSELAYAGRKARAAAQQVNGAGSAASGGVPPEEYQDFLNDLGLEDLDLDMNPQEAPAQEEDDLIGPEDIDLVEITDRSRIFTDIYPLTFRCRRCGHFQVLTGSETDLSCPDCKERKNRADSQEPVPQMVQESIIFICPHCATIEELTPWGTTLKDARSGVFDCPRKCGGHLHFYRWDRLSNAYWQCTKCGWQEKPVRRNCGSCSIYSDGRTNEQNSEQNDESQVWPMRLNPTSATNTYSLQKTFVEVNKQDITLDLLRAKQRQDQATGKRSWQLPDLMSGLDQFTRKAFQDTYDLADAFIVNDIESSTAVYGYTSRVNSSKPIREGERLSKGFPRKGGRYRAYLIKSTGRGLVLAFDKVKVAAIAQEGQPRTKLRSYDELVEDELMTLEAGIFQENLDNSEGFPVMAAMHAIEHALFKKATEEAGLEVFGSKVLLRDAAVLLFEREDVGEGGVIQLVTGEQFLRLANGIYGELSSCGQNCDKGCLSCTFITDFYCAPFLETECSRWYPANSFLDRSLAGRIIGPSEVKNAAPGVD